PEAQLLAQYVGKEIFTGMHRSAIDLSRVYHDGGGARLHSRSELREIIFPHLYIGHIDGCTILARAAGGIAKIMFPAAGYRRGIAQPILFISLYDGGAHGLADVYIFPVCFREPRPQGL